MTDPNLASVADDPLSQLQSAPHSKKQLQLIDNLATQGETGLAVLREFLQTQVPQGLSITLGKAYQKVYQATDETNQNFLQTHFPNGIVPLNSERHIDYKPLQQQLAAQDFQEADRLTLLKMCELAGGSALERQWLYFSEVDNFPALDLHTINNLWLMHSEGKFGFSVQREIWLAQGQNFNKVWEKIAWKTANRWTRYPNEFIWDLSAPKGHLPLSNQLRGSRAIASLLSHPAWTATDSSST
ncbi:MAG: GUN4 N-terminal ARM-like repeat domain-containing protein [Jaaginema sp. PMC 1079.18]|nr:GUN4 N-terminal ARM-like repeat domain-containing protein [Jaaginema sp. PMC 1080.18]MEC4851313.1 GUN4 N-terminal ARM-like repeat domain-containing protein [Jaaginema sp. PMC 1079.18]MEC4866314.1 GUN4 N-terminal ARM-like repeat domain-containing protein [Jaaginema sp. PMC 1078.18]